MKKTGFTMIELLVTVVIVGVLMTAGVVSYRNSTSKARDSKRISHMEQIRSALEMYRADSGSYPLAAAMPGAIVSAYIPVWPDAPGDDAYVYTGGGTTYSLSAYIENTTGMQIYTTCSIAATCGSQSCSYCLPNP